MVYLSTRGAGAGRRQGRLTIEPTIYCFTNCDRVELFHDRQSLGSKSHAPGEVLTWQFNLTSGVLKAIGKKGAAEAAFELRKAEGPSQIALTSDVTALKSDGQDVAQIEVDVTDKHGTLVPDASNLLECIISGPGRILGIENADLQNTEDYKATSHHVYQGRLRIYVQSRKVGGEINLDVSAVGLKAANMSIETQAE
jgi:beta-galactosidase